MNRRHDPIAEPRPIRPRRDCDARPAITDRLGHALSETTRRHIDAQAMAADGYFQAQRLDVERVHEDRSSLARLTAMIADASRDTGGDPGGMARWLIAQGVRL